jgi:LDH2 family malate/lactate/ureidoglycolate dehydrogenase
MRLAIKKAQPMGRGAVSVFNSHYFGAAGYNAALASSAGLLCERCSVPFLLEPATR